MTKNKFHRIPTLQQQSTGMDSFGVVTQFDLATYERMIIDRICLSYTLLDAKKHKTKIFWKILPRKKYTFPKVNNRLSFTPSGHVIGKLHIPCRFYNPHPNIVAGSKVFTTSCFAHIYQNYTL